MVSAFAAVEETINASGAPVRHPRSAFFMENLLESLPTIVNPGAIFYNGPGDLPLPMVCVADVARKAVDLLCDRSWNDQGHVAIHGPTHVTFDDMASIVSNVLGKPVRYVQVPDQVLIDNLTLVGLREGFALAYARLLTEEALKGYAIEPRTADTTTGTTLDEWARTVLRPAFETFQQQSAL
ncbi:NmrA family NAD(P)-binding protein [Sphingomonas sp. PAMC 26621]|uniref:NmrA family NAD(P)-binding protein n=1 Tax=Sphingomonas sp. PAMC 26621 TaxID=1112213 RepID=UPI001EE66B95